MHHRNIHRSRTSIHRTFPSPMKKACQKKIEFSFFLSFLGPRSNDLLHSHHPSLPLILPILRQTFHRVGKSSHSKRLRSFTYSQNICPCRCSSLPQLGTQRIRLCPIRIKYHAMGSIRSFAISNPVVDFG